MEIFFLASNNAEMYIELEFGPYGHHLGLLLHGRRNCLIHSFPITYNAKIGTSTLPWKRHLPKWNELVLPPCWD